MMRTKHANDRLQGTLDLLILKSLTWRRRMHGYAIATHIQSVSAEALRIEEGSLYPALHRMAQAGWITAEWGRTATNRRARFYALTAAGRRQLQAEERNWQALTAAVNRVLRHA
jgi:PadR family transcriptional regulator, regulatory protein PadR